MVDNINVDFYLYYLFMSILFHLLRQRISAHAIKKLFSVFIDITTIYDHCMFKQCGLRKYFSMLYDCFLQTKSYLKYAKLINFVFF